MRGLLRWLATNLGALLLAFVIVESMSSKGVVTVLLALVIAFYWEWSLDE